MSDQRVQQPSAATRWRGLHGCACQSNKLHRPRWMDRLVGLVSLLSDLRFRDKNPPTDLHESGARVRRSRLRRPRPRWYRVHRSAALSRTSEGHSTAAEWPVVKLGPVARVFAAVQRRWVPVSYVIIANCHENICTLNKLNSRNQETYSKEKRKIFNLRE